MRRGLIFWGKNTLETVGLSVGVALILVLLRGAGTGGQMRKNIINMAEIFPFFLMTAGFFVMMMAIVGYFQVYFSLLVSMNVTRRTVIAGIMSGTGVTALAILFLMFLVWRMIPGDISETGLELLPMFAGIFFAASAVCIILGVVVTRWGKIGVIIMVVFYLFLGGCIGGSTAVMLNNDTDLLGILHWFAENLFTAVAVVGVVLFAASGIFAAAALRKAEVRS